MAEWMAGKTNEQAMMMTEMEWRDKLLRNNNNNNIPSKNCRAVS